MTDLGSTINGFTPNTFHPYYRVISNHVTDKNGWKKYSFVCLHLIIYVRVCV